LTVCPSIGDFLCAALGESAHFLDDVGGRSAALAPARGRHNAEGAELVAAVLDGHKRLEFRRAVNLAFGDVGDDCAFAFGQVEAHRQPPFLERLFQ
jgi:hypothetical protein